MTEIDVKRPLLEAWKEVDGAAVTEVDATNFEKRVRNDLVKKMYYFQAGIEISEGALFAFATDRCLSSSVLWDLKPEIVWCTFGLVPLVLWPLALLSYHRFSRLSQSPTTWRSALALYMISLTLLGVILFQYALAILYYIFRSEGVILNPAAYLWYSTYIAGSLLIIMAHSGVHESYGQTESIRKSLCKSIRLILLMLLSTFAAPQLFPSIATLDIPIASMVVLINSVGIAVLVRRNHAVLEAMVDETLLSWEGKSSEGGCSEVMGWNKFLEMFVEFGAGSGDGVRGI
ncbi:hypothetical protein HK104_003864 [Borealophlyctis nickersoniae]|nr:hypothetical protein HK104_003864 [Borealophlyctis nickersoniae]